MQRSLTIGASGAIPPALLDALLPGKGVLRRPNAGDLTALSTPPRHRLAQHLGRRTWIARCRPTSRFSLAATREEIILAAERDWPNGAFGGVVVAHFEAAIVGKARQGVPARGRVADGLCERTLDTDHTSDPRGPCAWRPRSCRAPARRSPRARTGQRRAA